MRKHEIYKAYQVFLHKESDNRFNICVYMQYNNRKKTRVNKLYKKKKKDNVKSELVSYCSTTRIISTKLEYFLPRSSLSTIPS